MKLNLTWLLSALPLLAQLAHADNVTVQIKMLSPEALEVSYQLPPTCDQLSFMNTGGSYTAIRKSWQALDDCGSTSTNGEALTRSKPACESLRFRVPTSTQSFDRVYPGSFPMGNAIFAHTSNYAVKTACGAVDYQFVAPGSVAFSGKQYVQRASKAMDDAAYMPVLLTQNRLPDTGKALTYFDPALGEETIHSIQDTAETTIAFYRKHLPDAPFRMPILTAALAKDQYGPHFWGDAGDILRLALYNWPQQMPADLNRTLREFVAHEFAHRFQTIDASDPLETEGRAEYLRWTIAISKQWVSTDMAAKDLDDALAQCLIGSAGHSWGALPKQYREFGRLPYQCGLALHVYGLAVRQTKNKPLEQINGYYRDKSQGKSASFARIVECGDKLPCTPMWLLRFLGKEEKMEQVWADFFQQTGLAKPVEPTQVQINAMQQNAFSQLMQEDCGGSISSYTHATDIQIGEIQGCRTLRKDMVVTKIEGIDLLSEATLLPTMSKVCAEKSEVSVGLKDGAAIKLSCRKPYRAPATFYAVDAEKNI